MGKIQILEIFLISRTFNLSDFSGDLALAQYISMGKIQTLEIFLISRTFNLSDFSGLPSSYLGLSVKKIQIPTYKFTHMTTLYTNEYLPLQVTLDPQPVNVFHTHTVSPTLVRLWDSVPPMHGQSPH